MNRIINEISHLYADANVNDLKLTKYLQMRSHPGWNVHQELLLMFRGKIAEELLSRRFTEKDQTTKDIEQRAYMMVDELIRFLLNPLEKAQKRAEFARNFERAVEASYGKRPQRS